MACTRKNRRETPVAAGSCAHRKHRDHARFEPSGDRILQKIGGGVVLAPAARHDVGAERAVGVLICPDRGWAHGPLDARQSPLVGGVTGEVEDLAGVRNEKRAEKRGKSETQKRSKKIKQPNNQTTISNREATERQEPRAKKATPPLTLPLIHFDPGATPTPDSFEPDRIPWTLVPWPSLSKGTSFL